MASTPQPSETERAFVRVACSKKALQDTWIPLFYWSYLINQELRVSCFARNKLRSVLSKRNALDRSFTDADTPVFRTITRIASNQKSISVAPTETFKGNKQKVFFLRVTLSNSKAAEQEMMPTKRDSIAQHFQDQYEKYEKLIQTSSQHGSSHTRKRKELTVNTTFVSAGYNTMARVTPEPQSTQAASVATTRNLPPTNEDPPPPNEEHAIVTPTASDTEDDDCLLPADIVALLSGVVKETVLTEDIFVDGDRSYAELRKRVQRLGCERQKIANTKHYKQFKVSHQFKKKDITQLDPSAHFVLTNRFHVPLTLAAVRDLAHSIVTLAEDVPEVLEFDKWGGSKGSGKRIVANIVPSTNKQRLYANAKQYMPSIIEAAVAPDSELATYHVICELIKVLSKIDFQAFTDVCRKYQETKKIEVETQRALVCEAHLTQHQLALVRMYSIYALGYNMWQPFEKVKQLDADVFPVTPIEFVDSYRKRSCHYRSIDELLRWSINRTLRDDNSRVDRITDCHIVMGGDHGQGAFRMVVTVLLFAGSELKHEEDFLCGFIECKKDTYSILQKTIATPLNNSLKRIAAGEELVICEQYTGDKQRSVEWGAAAAAARTDASIVAAVPVTMFHTGDLAYYSMIQGRPDCASWWCPRCQWGKNDWKTLKAPDEPQVGAAWTKQSMEEHLIKVKQKKMSKYESKGFKPTSDGPLFDAIPVENTLTPLLHSVDLFVNSVKDLLDHFIDHRLENRPIELLEARRLEADAKIAEREAFKDLEIYEIAVKELQQELQAGVGGDVGPLLQHAMGALEAAKLAHADAKKEFGKAAASARRLEKKKEYGAMSQGLRQQVDGLLGDLFHILRSSYHGGDMEGNYCRKLIRLADSVMDSVEVLLVSVPPEDRAPGCDDDEINERCAAFKRLFQYFDILSHYCYQPYGTLTDQEIVNIKILVPRMDRLWRKLAKNTPPKVHMWRHLVEDLERLRGMKYHNESKVEVAHQIGRQTESRFRAMAGSVKRKIKAAMQFQANLADPATKAKIAHIRAARSRQFGDKTKEARQQKKEAAKRLKQDDILAVLNLPEIEDTLLGVLDLTIIDRQAELAESAKGGSSSENT